MKGPSQPMQSALGKANAVTLTSRRAASRFQRCPPSLSAVEDGERFRGSAMEYG